MSWVCKFNDSARRELAKLDRSVQVQIIRYLEERVAKDPRRHGKPLQGELAGLWRYRVRDWRLICALRDQELLVLVVRIGHRSKVYR